MQEYPLSQSPARRGYRAYDPLSPQRRMYAVLLNVSYTGENIVIDDGETAVGQQQLRLLGTTNFSILGMGKLAIL
jgi:hypothetical protein